MPRYQKTRRTICEAEIQFVFFEEKNDSTVAKNLGSFIFLEGSWRIWPLSQHVICFFQGFAVWSCRLFEEVLKWCVFFSPHGWRVSFKGVFEQLGTTEPTQFCRQVTHRNPWVRWSNLGWSWRLPHACESVESPEKNSCHSEGPPLWKWDITPVHPT